MSVRRDKVEDTPFVQRLRSLMGGKTMPLPARIGGGLFAGGLCCGSVRSNVRAGVALQVDGVAALPVAGHARQAACRGRYCVSGS